MEGKECGLAKCGDITWWAKLVVAVLAVPAMGIIITSLFPATEFFQLAIFIVACWVCTYLGMRLMQHPKIAEMMDNKKD